MVWDLDVHCELQVEAPESGWSRQRDLDEMEKLYEPGGEYYHTSDGPLSEVIVLQQFVRVHFLSS